MGSSASSSRRAARDGHRDQHALAPSRPTSRAGTGRRAAGRRGCRRARAARWPASLGAALEPVVALRATSAIWRADGQHRVERLTSAPGRPCRSPCRGSRAAALRPPAAGPRRRAAPRRRSISPPAGRSPRIDIASIVLPQPDSPTSASDLARLDRERDVVDGLDEAPAGQPDPDGHVAPDVEDGGHRSSLGSSTSRRPSPTRLNDRAVIRMASPGMIPSHGAVPGTAGPR